VILPGVLDSVDSDQPAVYRIRVAGRLGERWRDRAGGLEMTIHEGHGTPVETELAGLLADQAALMGILEQLYARGAAILSVERVKPSSEADREERAPK